MKNNIFIAIIINIIITVFEIVLGLLSGSMALISDALHNFSDVGAMVLSWWGEKVSRKPNDKFKTYGYKRAEIIIAFINSSILLAVVIFILIESVKRLFQPIEVAGLSMFIVAGIALVGNSLATYLLEKDKHKNLNLKSAWLHSVQDALFSLGVVIGAIIIHYTGWFILDPLISIFLSVYILKEVIDIIKKSINVLMESVPTDINLEQVRKNIEGFNQVIKVADLHIWQSDSRDKFLSVHIEIDNVDNGQRNKILADIQRFLCDNFKICHTTLQLTSMNETEKNNLNCNHCN